MACHSKCLLKNVGWDISDSREQKPYFVAGDYTPRLQRGHAPFGVFTQKSGWSSKELPNQPQG
jgi:hypothetical protein